LLTKHKTSVFFLCEVTPSGGARQKSLGWPSAKNSHTFVQVWMKKL